MGVKVKGCREIPRQCEKCGGNSFSFVLGTNCRIMACVGCGTEYEAAGKNFLEPTFKKARGKMKKVLRQVEEIQHEIGKAKAAFFNDRDPLRAEKIEAALELAHTLCITITAGYDKSYRE